MTATTVTAPDQALATFLAAAGLSLIEEATPAAAGQNLFKGEARPAGPGIPINAVFIGVYGGPAPVPYFRPGTHGSIWTAKVQVRVRRDAGHRPDAQVLARNIAMTLHCATIPEYIRCVVTQSEPIYLGQDKAWNHEYSLNVELMRKE